MVLQSPGMFLLQALGLLKVELKVVAAAVVVGLGFRGLGFRV